LAPTRVETKAVGINPQSPEPIKVTLLSIKSDQNRKTRESSSWVNQPLVQIENISGKAIKYLTVEIRFPGSDALKMPFMLAYGQAPGRKAATQPGGLLQPGARINLTVGENGGGRIGTRFLAQKIAPPPGLTMTTTISGVIFADETAWFDGMLHVPDKNNPLRWYIVGENPDNINPATLLTVESIRAGSARSHAAQGCYRKRGTEMIECCDLIFPSALLSQDPFGYDEPLVLTHTCEDGSTCEYIKAVYCGTGGE
ncbi:MAG TPA: hypothetical protein VJT09_06475, partial [Pyrinomonadaceae bacterium]|nr:hypothetical protein [Pyrinomonadaceae bacterium]